MKKLFPTAILTLSLVALAFTGQPDVAQARNDARLDKLESRVSALEAKIDMMQHKARDERVLALVTGARKRDQLDRSPSECSREVTGARSAISLIRKSERVFTRPTGERSASSLIAVHSQAPLLKPSPRAPKLRHDPLHILRDPNARRVDSHLRRRRHLVRLIDPPSRSRPHPRARTREQPLRIARFAHSPSARRRTPRGNLSGPAIDPRARATQLRRRRHQRGDDDQPLPP